ncbi:hypothetical protein [Microbacterium sp. SD291]|uniref:hypothetical protein n=1 Tax=Microbacterium sp. SD291 TaxID=2782007 RepID=UPI001A959257|nr:hypothetical protein [Microbacterium sp. SD291]MBO0980183.1 hypothetical protein [Microbacterium sp. SD291]
MDDLARDRPSASETRAHVRPWWRTPEDAVPVVLPIVEPLVRAPAVAITLVGAHVGISRESVAIDTPHLIEMSQQSRPLWSDVEGR